MDRHIVHRDLKPANIFVRLDAGRDGRSTLVVGDVGLAKVLAHTAAFVSFAGTPAYLAPEVAAVGGGAGACSLASDIFSASLVAMEMVTSECVYSACGPAVPGDGRREQLVARAQARAEAVLAFAEDSRLTVEALGALLEACTRPAPSERVTFREIDARCRWPAADAKARTDAEANATAAAARAAEAEAKLARLEAEAKAHAEAEARARAEAAAKARTEAEAKARAEAEAKAHADAEAKARTEAEAKARADVEAKARAEAEAKAHAEAEAKARAEAEAKAPAEARQAASATCAYPVVDVMARPQSWSCPCTAARHLSSLRAASRCPCRRIYCCWWCSVDVDTGPCGELHSRRTASG